jgi:hypothetical protein
VGKSLHTGKKSNKRVGRGEEEQSNGLTPGQTGVDAGRCKAHECALAYIRPLSALKRDETNY